MSCPGPEILAAMAEQRLPAGERETVLDHLAGCDDCRHGLLVLGALKKPAATIRIRPAARSWMPWAAAAAVFAVCVLAVVLSNRRPEEPTVVRTIPPKEDPRVEPERPKPVAPVEVPKPAPAPKPEVPAPAPKDPVMPTPPKPAPVEPETPKPPVEPESVKPAPAPEPPKPATISVVAILDRAEGDVQVAGAPAKAGQEIRPGQKIETRGARSWALLGYPDKTRMEVEGDTVVREILAREPGKGLRILVDRGAVKADVAKQPVGQPMMFETPHGDAKVLGTTLRIQVDADPKKGTRLEVEEGRVELRNAAGKSTLVETGHSAVAAAGLALAAKKLPKEEVLFLMEFEDGKKPAALSKGTVAVGPDRRTCFSVDADAGGSARVYVSGEEPDGLGLFTGDEILSFDYWVDAQCSSVNFHFWNSSQKVAHEAEVPKLVTNKWTRVTLKISELGDPAARVKDGDRIGNFFLQATGGPPRKFYVDNLALYRPRSLKPRPVETK